MSTLNKAFVALEQVVARVVVNIVDEPAVANAIFDLGRVGRAGLTRVEDARATLVHVLALPSHQDIRQLDAHLARLAVAVAELEAQLNDLRSEPDNHGD